MRWPGYVLQNAFIIPESDHLIHVDDLLSLLRSKNIDRYQSEKDHFFGPTSRYTTGNSRE